MNVHEYALWQPKICRNKTSIWSLVSWFLKFSVIWSVSVGWMLAGMGMSVFHCTIFVWRISRVCRFTCLINLSLLTSKRKQHVLHIVVSHPRLRAADRLRSLQFFCIPVVCKVVSIYISTSWPILPSVRFFLGNSCHPSYHSTFFKVANGFF